MCSPQNAWKCLNTTILYHKHSTFWILIKLATHAYIKTYMNIWRLWYRRICHVWWSQPNEKPFPLPDTWNLLPHASPPITDNIMNEFGCTDTYYNMNIFCKMLWGTSSCLIGITRNTQKVTHIFCLQFGMP